jgi:prevent-host-death family protein
MRIESLREVRDHFSEVVDRVEREHERVTVTRNGRAAAVILSPDDLAQLEETLEILSDPDALADIREADAAYRTGDVVRGVGPPEPCACDRAGPLRTSPHSAGDPRHSTHAA